MIYEFFTRMRDTGAEYGRGFSSLSASGRYMIYTPRVGGDGRHSLLSSVFKAMMI